MICQHCFRPHPRIRTLQDLIRMVRNSVAHFNLEIEAHERRIERIHMRNYNHKGSLTWEDVISVKELRSFLDYQS